MAGMLGTSGMFLNNASKMLRAHGFTHHIIVHDEAVADILHEFAGSGEAGFFVKGD